MVWLSSKKRGAVAFNRHTRAKYQTGSYFLASLMFVNQGAIVSRKLTYLSVIKLETARYYIREIELKYPPGAIVADVPSNKVREGLSPGDILEGQKILEVPVQNTIPQEILDYATLKKVAIRDINGKCYNLVMVPQC